MNEAEKRFAAYLDSHGYHWKHEPDYQLELGLQAPLATRPDFLITSGGTRTVGEVRQFETTHLREQLAKSGGRGFLSAKTVYGALRSGIFEKARQLRPLAGAGVPLLVVLANPLGADVMLDAHHVQAAMWGNPGYVFRVDGQTGEPAPEFPPFMRLQDYGVFARPVMDGDRIVGWENRHPHVSAVVVVHERLHSDDWREEIIRRHPAADGSFDAAGEAAFAALKAVEAAASAGEEPEGAYQWVSVYDVNGDKAVPVPPDWFAGRRDERFGYTAGGYGKLTPVV
jgi:hypothetical protein